MTIGFYIKYNIGTLGLESKVGTLGDEIIALSLSKYLNRIEGINAKVYGNNHKPLQKIDIMIYMNDTVPTKEWADIHIAYFQNGYDKEGADNVLKKFYNFGFDDYLIYSKKLFDLHISANQRGLYLPFAVDIEIFYPTQIEDNFKFDCIYIGNDIKGKERTVKYIYPAVDFNFGIFGNWTYERLSLKRKILRFLRLKKYDYGHHYQKIIASISKGKISAYEQLKVYSSSKIILNCTMQDSVDWDKITLRTYEVLACKGFLITDHLPKYYSGLNNCLVVTQGNDDLKNKIRYYLTNSDERTQIAENGYNYVINFGTYAIRARELYNYLKFYDKNVGT